MKHLKHRRNKKGHATVEFMLLIPIFVSFIGFSNMLGSLSRLFAYNNSVGADMLRYADGSDYNTLVSARSSSRNAQEDVEKMWQSNNPNSEIDVNVINLVSQNGPSYSATGLTTQTGLSYVNDRYSLFEEKEQQTTLSIIYNAQTDTYTENWGYTPEGYYLFRHGDEGEFANTTTLLNDRSIHRSINFEISSSPWISTVIMEKKDTPAHKTDFSRNVESMYTIQGRHFQHYRNPNLSVNDWKMYNDQDSFHNDLDTFLGGATLPEPAGWGGGVLKTLRTNESLNP